MADEIIIETVSAEVIEVGVPGPQGPAGAAGTGLETLTTKGDTLYRGDTTGERLPIGTTGQILRVSASGIPEWGSAPASGVSSVNGETGAVTLDGSEIDTSGNDDLAAFVTYEFADGNGLYYPLPDSTLNNKRVYRTTTGHHVFFQSLRWHITDGSPNTQNIIESSDNDNAAWPWLSAWDGSMEKAQLSTIVGRARSTFLFVGDSIPNTSVSGLSSVAASGDYDDLSGKPTLGGAAALNVGTTTGTVAAGDDARLSDSRTPSSHAASHASAGSDPVTLDPSQVVSVSGFGIWGGGESLVDVVYNIPSSTQPLGLDGGGLGTNASAFDGLVKITGGATSAVGIGTGSTEVAAGDHSHGNLSTDGKLGSTAGLPVVTTTAGAVTTLALGTAGQVLTVNSGATGVEFAAASGGGVTTGSVDNAILRADGTGGSTSQGSAFIIADNATASPNNTVNHASIQATGGSTNVSVSIVPKGTGAFSLHVPDAATAGGNVRGANAADLQTARAAATQIASGANASVLGGVNNTASGTQSVVCGGSGNTASGFQASVLGGRSNTANQDRAVAFGDGNTASGANTTAIGAGNTASAGQGFACGSNSRADRVNLFAHGSGAFSTAGDAQRIRAVLRCKTTTNAAVEMALDGSTTYLTIPSGKVIHAEIRIVGSKSDGTAVACYTRQYAAKNVAGTSSEVFAPVTIGTDTAAGTSLEVATVDAGDYIRIRPTGIASETWRWVASVDAVEVAYGS